MGFIFSSCVCHAELPCGIHVPRAASRAGPGHQHSGKGDQEASVLLPLCLQDTVLEAFHEGVKNVSLWGNEANHRADLPEMTVPLPVTKSTSARGSPGHSLQVTTEAHSEQTQKRSFGCPHQTSRKICSTWHIQKAEAPAASHHASSGRCQWLTRVSLPCGAEGKHK